MPLSLPRLPAGQRLVDENGMPSLAFTVYWQQVLEALEAQEAAQDLVVAELTQITTQLTDQLALITAAQAAAEAAQVSADDAVRINNIAASSVIPANVLSASDAGANATITIAAHTRIYGDGSQLAVSGGTITGRPYSTVHAVYYDDATLANTAPTFLSTTVASNALNNFAPGRHYLGLITTPAAAGAPTTGGSSPPGTGGDDRDAFSNL